MFDECSAGAKGRGERSDFCDVHDWSYFINNELYSPQNSCFKVRFPSDQKQYSLSSSARADET